MCQGWLLNLDSHETHHHFDQQFIRCILLMSLVLQSCTNRTNPIIPIQEKEIDIIYKASKPIEESISLVSSVDDYLDLAVSDNTFIKGLNIK